MAMMAKFFVFMSFAAIYVYSAELFPTVVRNVGMGTSTAAGRVGSFSAPYVVQLNRVHPLLPFGIMAAQAFLAGILCMSLPETKDKPTEETLSGDAKEAAVNAVAMEELNQEEPQLLNQNVDGQESIKDKQEGSGNVLRIDVAEQEKNKADLGYVNTAF